MKTISFEVTDKIIGAVRMTQRSKYFDERAKAYLAYKAQIGAKAREACQEMIPEGAPITVYITAFISDTKIDLDNVIKAVLDGCNKVVWKDDCYVTRIDAEKFTSIFDNLMVRIEQTGEPVARDVQRTTTTRRRDRRETPTIGYPAGHRSRDH